MGSRFFALLIHNPSEPFEELKEILKNLDVAACSVRTIEEARRLLLQTEPHLVFSEPALADGPFDRLMNLAEDSCVPLNVIVVGSLKDIKHYLPTMARGAFAFIVPPFDSKTLEQLIWAAGEDVRQRRRALLSTASAA